MENASNVRDLAKVRANVKWLNTYDPICPRRLDGHDGRPSLDPVKWGRIKCIDDGMVSAIGITARNTESYIDMHCIYGLVLGIFRLMIFSAGVVFLAYRVWHMAWMFCVIFLVTFALPKIFGRKRVSHLILPNERKEQ